MHAGPYNTGIKFFDLEACLGNEGFHAHHVVHVALHNHVLEALKKKGLHFKRKHLFVHATKSGR